MTESESFAGPFAQSYWAREGQLLAGPFPDRHIDALAGAGVTAIINLTEPHEGDYTGYLPHTIAHYRHAIMDFRTPSPQQITAILDQIDALLAQGETVYVHCWAGIGRTGTIIGCWLVRHGMDGDAALETLHARRGRYPETPEQREMVRTWAEHAE